MGSMYSSVLFLGVSNSSTVQPVVAIERTVFYRERAAGMYSALPYAFGQVSPPTCSSYDQCIHNIELLLHIYLMIFNECAGCSRDPIHHGSGYNIRHHCLLDDRVRMDGYKVLLVSFLHILHIPVLHILWNDGSGFDSKL